MFNRLLKNLICKDWHTSIRHINQRQRQSASMKKIEKNKIVRDTRQTRNHFQWQFNEKHECEMHFPIKMSIVSATCDVSLHVVCCARLWSSLNNIDNKNKFVQNGSIWVISSALTQAQQWLRAEKFPPKMSFAFEFSECVRVILHNDLQQYERVNGER